MELFINRVLQTIMFFVLEKENLKILFQKITIHLELLHLSVVDMKQPSFLKEIADIEREFHETGTREAHNL